ncbi:hypothetical protein AOLI_G00083420 [Acnodon oligacanthus]
MREPKNVRTACSALHFIDEKKSYARSGAPTSRSFSAAIGEKKTRSGVGVAKPRFPIRAFTQIITSLTSTPVQTVDSVTVSVCRQFICSLRFSFQKSRTAFGRGELLRACALDF